VKLLPSPRPLSTQIRPPWASTIPKTMLNPNPAPPEPLVRTIPANVTDHFNYSIGTREAAFPTGSASIDSGEMSKIVQASG